MGVLSAIKTAAKAAAPTLLNTALGGTIGYGGAKETARMNKEIAREQMAFQERMSNSAYQRAALDMEKAGLNRILAIGSPATTPGGAALAAPDFGSAAAAGMQTGMNIGSTAQDISTKQQQQAKTLMETLNLGQKNAQMIVQTELWQRIGEKVIQGIKAYNTGNAETFTSWLKANYEWIKSEIEGLPNAARLAWKEMWQKEPLLIEIKRGNDGVR